jgi:5'-methylthioadenosine/S-adenosylhomocysteine nucleosidase
MRPIAIMAAMQEEMVGLTIALQGARTIHNGSRQFTTGTRHGQAVVLVLSRIGKVAAATTATALIERFNVSAIVFTGVAGGLASGVNVGDMDGGIRIRSARHGRFPLVSPLRGALVWAGTLPYRYSFDP